ncbi:MAG: signal peptidase I [Epulopiscium sp. Nuni2H_MBin003]|nr:MAG: signal peptidase I [Epulopiscium sp. Nuni2H_MBin003]
MLKVRNIFQIISELLLAILSAVIITQFIFMHSSVPTGSMIPTILIGDHLALNKITAYYRMPKRGEIIVFFNGQDNLIKRVIALPGEEVDLINGIVLINGTPLDEPYLNEPNSTFPITYNIDFPYVVPDEYIFVLGDNRKNSSDSRDFGPISRHDIVSIGAYRIYPFSDMEVLH